MRPTCTLAQAHQLALKDAGDYVIQKTRVAVHTQKIAEHLSVATGLQILVDDDTWDRNWRDIVEACEYYDDLLTAR